MRKTKENDSARKQNGRGCVSMKSSMRQKYENESETKSRNDTENLTKQTNRQTKWKRCETKRKIYGAADS